MTNSSEEKNPRSLAEENRLRQREQILVELLKKAPDSSGVGCFLCGWIFDDLKKNPKLTGYPIDSNGGAVFPRAGKIDHLRLEGIYLPS